MSAQAPLASKDVNAPMEAKDSGVATGDVKAAGGVKSLEYHRQMLQNKIAADQRYVWSLLLGF